MSAASDMMTTIDTAIASIVAKEAASIQVDGATYTALDLDKLRLLRKHYAEIVGRETAAAASRPPFGVNTLVTGSGR